MPFSSHIFYLSLVCIFLETKQSIRNIFAQQIKNIYAKHTNPYKINSWFFSTGIT